MMNWNEYAAREVALATEAVCSIPEQDLAVLLGLVYETVATGHGILLCGNGGSATQALHIAAELTGRFRRERPPYGAIALVENIAAVTAIANDFGYDQVMSRQVEAFGHPGDLLLALTTSGNSESVLEAIRVARARGLTTVALTGASGGQALGLAHLTLRIASSDTAHVQEAHLVVGHLVAGAAEEALCDDPSRGISGSRRDAM
jgi:D-sedoheptulose 7-phosphate isomerase